MNGPANETATLDTLGALLRKISERRTLLLAVGALLDAIEPSRRVVAGERDRWRASAALLETAVGALEAMTSADGNAALTRATEAMDHEEWDILEEIREALIPVRDAQAARIEKLRAVTDALRSRLNDLELELSLAHAALTPTRAAGRVNDRIKDLRERASRDLVSGSASILLLESALLGAQEELEKVIAALATSTDDAQLRLRHGELIMLRSSEKPGYDLYTALLRTPAEPGTVGIHVQGTSSLVVGDRSVVFDAIASLTQTLVGATLRRAPADVSAEAAALTADLASAEGDDHLQQTRGVTGKPPTSAAKIDVDETIEDLGELTFRLFLPERMQDYLRATPCALSLSTNDLEMPWELMTFDDKVLCLDRCVGRMPMGTSFPRQDRVPRWDNKRVRFLLVCADDNGKLEGARDEVQRIYDALTALQQTRLADEPAKLPIEVHVLRSPNVTGRELLRQIRRGKFNVIHFAGHARFDNEDPDLSALLLDGGEVFLAEKIRRVLTGRPLVFLNACNSAQIRNEAATRFLQEPAEGLAASFLYGGALGCIGSLWPVYDKPASDFAISFYSRILEGHVIGEAVRLARVEIKEKHKQHLTWATFVLYGNPTFRLES